MLAERAGVSDSTLRQIEIGGFGLTEAVARRIMLSTGVSMQSLLKGEDPLKGVGGGNLSHESASHMISELYYQQEISMFDMLGAALKAAKEKKRSTILYQLFTEWLPQAVDAIGATSGVKKVLNRRLGLFDTSYVPEAFQPTDPKIKKRWKESQNELFKAMLERAGKIEKAGDYPYVFANAYQDELNSRRAKQPTE
jgi:hypothetical protein